MITTNFVFDGENLRLKAPTIEEMQDYRRVNHIRGDIRHNQDYILLLMEQDFLFICEWLNEHVSWMDFYDLWQREDDVPTTISWTMLKSVYDEIKDQIESTANDMGIRDEEYEGFDNFEI